MDHHQSWASATATDPSRSDPIVPVSRSASASTDSAQESSPHAVTAESDRMTGIRSPHIMIDTRISDESPMAAGTMAPGSDCMDSNCDLHLASIAANLRPLKRCISAGRENWMDSARVNPNVRHIKPMECQIDSYCGSKEEESDEEFRDPNRSRSSKNLEESDDGFQSEASRCLTPTAKEFRIPEPKICPPAPKKHRRPPSAAYDSRTAMAARTIAVTHHSNNAVIRSTDSLPGGFNNNNNHHHNSNDTELSSSDRRAAMDHHDGQYPENNSVIIHCRSENPICFFRPQPDELHTIPDSMKTLFSS